MSARIYWRWDTFLDESIITLFNETRIIGCLDNVLHQANLMIAIEKKAQRETGESSAYNESYAQILRASDDGMHSKEFDRENYEVWDNIPESELANWEMQLFIASVNATARRMKAALNPYENEPGYVAAAIVKGTLVEL